MKKLKTTNSPSVILKLKNIKPNSKITLFNIAHCIKLKWTLSQGLLAEMGGMSERTINRCLNELEENGYIKRETKLFNGKGKETSYTIIWDSITKYAKEYEWYDDKNSNTVDLSPTNNEDIQTPQQVEDDTFEKIDLPKENEMVETLLSDEELIEYVANKFIKTEGEDGYNMFVKLNNTDPKSDEFRVLTNKWLCKWGRYITTEKRNVLSGKITDIVCGKYYQRYKEIA